MAAIPRHGQVPGLRVREHKRARENNETRHEGAPGTGAQNVAGRRSRGGRGEREGGKVRKPVGDSLLGLVRHKARRCSTRPDKQKRMRLHAAAEGNSVPGRSQATPLPGKLQCRVISPRYGASSFWLSCWFHPFVRTAAAALGRECAIAVQQQAQVRFYDFVGPNNSTGDDVPPSGTEHGGKHKSCACGSTSVVCLAHGGVLSTTPCLLLGLTSLSRTVGESRRWACSQERRQSVTLKTPSLACPCRCFRARLCIGARACACVPCACAIRAWLDSAP